MRQALQQAVHARVGTARQWSASLSAFVNLIILERLSCIPMQHLIPINTCRRGKKPDGICCVVGSLCSGFPKDENGFSDLIFSDRDMQLFQDGTPKAQYFWEAFPAGAGPTHRTTYMFTYLDAGAPQTSCSQAPASGLADVQCNCIERIPGREQRSFFTVTGVRCLGSCDTLQTYNHRHHACQARLCRFLHAQQHAGVVRRPQAAFA